MLRRVPNEAFPEISFAQAQTDSIALLQRCQKGNSADAYRTAAVKILRKPVPFGFIWIAEHPRNSAPMKARYLLPERDNKLRLALKQISMQLRQLVPRHRGLCVMSVMITKVERNEIQPWISDRNNITECMGLLIIPVTPVLQAGQCGYRPQG